METAESNDRLFLAFAAALGLIVAGAGNALFGPRRWWARTSIAAVGFAVALGAALALIPGAIDAVFLGGGAFLLVVSLVHVEPIRRAIAVVWSQLQKPRIGWAAVALAGAATMAHEMARYDAIREAADRRDIEDMVAYPDANPYVVDEACLAKTDRGSGIHLLSVSEAQSSEYLAASEQQTILAGPVAEYIIRRGPPDDSSNCHGWVFSGGKFAIRGAEVDTILAENEYDPVPAPQPGDLCVYRNDTNGVAHTAIVRSVLDDGTVLVEGKWGRLGVFLHPVGHSAYGAQFSYYRTDRGTHVLRSIPGSSN